MLDIKLIKIKGIRSYLVHNHEEQCVTCKLKIKLIIEITND